MGKRLTTEDFIQRATKIHNGKYDYTNSVYVKTDSPIIIECPTHGRFEQLPKIHLNGRSECPKCSLERCTEAKVQDIDTIISRANTIHNHKYDYSLVDYVRMEHKVKIICTEHGVFEQSINNHINMKQGCPRCGQIYGTRASTTEQFIQKSKMIHGNDVFDYSLVEYVTNIIPVTLKCIKHNHTYSQKPDYHLSNTIDCPVCVIKSKQGGNRFGGYNETIFSRKPELKEKQGFLYIIELSDGLECFYKIGITTRCLSKRFQHGVTGGYSVRQIKVKQMQLHRAYQVEQRFLQMNKKRTHIPKTKFDGWTECFV